MFIVNILASVTINLLLFAGILYTKKAENHILRLRLHLKEWAEGNLELRITNINEVGNMAEMLWSANSLVDKVDALIRETLAAMKAANEGRYYRKIMLNGLSGVFKSVAIDTNDRFTLIKDKKSQLTQSANEIETSITSIIESVNSSANETSKLSSSIDTINGQVLESTSIGDTVNSKVKDTVCKINNLSEASQKINNIVKIIKDIASQTNLLAINASVEAARAGDAGKGFAVVASEVRSLAGETGKAATEVTAQINNVKAYIDEVVKAIESVNATIIDMNTGFSNVTKIVKEQNDTVNSINNNMKQAVEKTKLANQKVGQVKAINL
jgi:methyl-accepting chemotaxis protein